MARQNTSPLGEILGRTATPLSQYSPGQLAKLTADQRARALKRTPKGAGPGAALTASTILSAGRS